jgi:hypothetical protein
MISRTTNPPMRQTKLEVDAEDFIVDGMILALMAQKIDTFDIAKQLHLREHQVANRMRILPRSRAPFLRSWRVTAFLIGSASRRLSTSRLP